MKNYFLNSILAGFAIAMGGWAYLMAPNPIVGAIIFACGLLSVRLYKLNLYTGKAQYIGTGKYPWYFYLFTLIGNFIGVALIAGISYGVVREPVAAIAAAKASQNFIVSMARGVGCGMLMSLATFEKTPLWITVLCVATFILGGMNHCVADFYYLLCGLTFSWNLIATIIGNTLGALILNGQRADQILDISTEI